MKKLYVFILLFTLALSDIFLLNMSHFLGYHLTNKYLVDVDQVVYLKNIWSCNIIWLISAAICSLYTVQSMQKLGKIYRSTVRTIILHVVLFSGYLLFTQSTFPIEFLASIIPLVGMSFVLSRFTALALRDLLPDTVVESLIPQTINSSDTVSVTS